MSRNETRARLKIYYSKEVLPLLMKKFNYKNPMQAPKLVKIALNIGVSDGGVDQKSIDSARDELSLIAGQHVVITKAKKSISNFKIRKGMPIGCKVTLRGERMYEFFDRLVNVALPRIRDFRGIPQNICDGHGNFTFGIKEHIIFPEIDLEKIYKVRGMDITIVTSAKTDEEGRGMLTCMGMPFAKKS